MEKGAGMSMDQAEKLRKMVRNQNTEEVASPEMDSVNKGHSRIITVTSGKGGVGKSSVAINLAVNFRRMGKSVIIFDADFGLANIEVMFGAIPKYNLSDLIYKGKEFQDIIVKGPMDVGFISGGSGITGLSNMTKEQVEFLVYKLQELEQLADIIIIDTGAGISDSVLEFVSLSQEVLLVTTPEPTSITDAYALLKNLSIRKNFNKEKTEIRILANKVSLEEDGANLFNKLSVVVEKFLKIHLEFLGTIPMDDHIVKSVMQQKPITIVYPKSPASRAFEKIGGILVENVTEETETKRGIAQIFAKLFRDK